MRQRVALLFTVICASGHLYAQSEAALREFFEGKTVVAKADLPATKTGVDVNPESSAAVNNAQYGKQLREFGAAIRRNEPATVSRVRVMSKSIEINLGEGESSTAGGDRTPTVYVAADKTPRERTLERELDSETDAARKERMQRELDDLRAQRQREDARLKAALASLAKASEESNRQRAVGSRFNLVFPGGVPSRALEPDYVISALKPWIDFDREVRRASETQAASPPAERPVPVQDSSTPPTELRKGLTETELRHLFGEPVKREPSTLGDFHVELLTFRQDGTVVEATMVEGVLVRFRQWSE